MFTQAAAASYQVTWDTAYVFPGATPAVKQEYDSLTVYTFIGGPSNTMLASAGPAAPTVVQADATHGLHRLMMLNRSLRCQIHRQ